jgi:cell wall-associated NlpC family hydrolase
MIPSQYALSFLGVPYIWGGNTPNPGWDCSGLMSEVGRACKVLPKGDYTAQSMFNYLLSKDWKIFRGVQIPDSAFLFFGKDVNDIEHVAVALGSSGDMVEAGGAGSNCLTVADAARLCAFTRVRSINTRPDLVAALVPPGGSS